MLTLRNAEKEDSELLYNWANDREVRSASIYSEPIQWEKHLDWFPKKLADVNTRMFVLQEDADPVGQIRFERKHNEWYIGYSIATEQRGKGYGKRIVELGLQEMGKGIFTALVRPANTASIKIFTTLQFNCVRSIEENGVQLAEFKLEKK